MPKKVLVVEDSSFQAEVLKATISELGCEVFIAACGMEAMESLAEDVNIVILDTVLPDIDGFELCGKIKEARPEGLTVVMTTGRIDAVDTFKAKQSGADDYAVKTQDYKHLVEVVRKYL